MKTLLLVPLLMVPLSAQEQLSRQTPPFVRVGGEGIVSLKPDQAEINIGVVTTSQNAEDAGAQNAKQTTAVVASLHDILGQGADIKTLNYSLTPTQRYRDGAPPTITGYTASNTVHVKTQNLAVVGKIIDTVTKSGANLIQGIQFNLRDEQAARAQALKQAAQQARATGEALASALG